AAAEPSEGFAAVGGLPNAGAFPPTRGGFVDVEAVAPALVGGDQQRLGVVGLHAHVDDAGLVIDEMDAVPGLAALHRPLPAAILAGRVEAAQGADVDDVGVVRVTHDPAGLKGLLQPHVGPGLAAVGRFVDPVAVRNRVARVVLAGAHPNDVPVRGRHAHAAD